MIQKNKRSKKRSPIRVNRKQDRSLKRERKNKKSRCVRRILNICAVVVLLKEKGTCCISCDVFNLNTTGGRWSRSDCFALLLFFCNRLPFSTLNQKGIPAVVTVIYEHCYFFKFQTISVRRTIAHVGFLRP